ncbi:MAG TPA: hypothetical protein VKY74_26615 [Chloroflexia bacterium]|nr:hypothetical protein [Chloroflexia bacterium]
MSYSYNPNPTPPAAGPSGYTPPGPYNPGNYQSPPPSPAGPPPRRGGGVAKRIGMSVLVRLLVVGGIALVGTALYSSGILSHVTAPDYPGGQKAALSTDGKKFADSLYRDNNADTSHLKAFVTTDDPPKIAAFYKGKMASDGWKVSQEDNKDGIFTAVYDKDKTETIMIAGSGALHWVNEATDQNNFVILLIGDQPSQ